jgi:hypothetical protein
MWLCGPLLGVWADVGAAPGDGEDQSFVAEDLDRSQDRVTAYVVLLLELHAGQTLTVAVSDTTPAIELDDAETRVVRRTTTTPVRNIKADRPWTVPSVS